MVDPSKVICVGSRTILEALTASKLTNGPMDLTFVLDYAMKAQKDAYVQDVIENFHPTDSWEVHLSRFCEKTSKFEIAEKLKNTLRKFENMALADVQLELQRIADIENPTAVQEDGEIDDAINELLEGAVSATIPTGLNILDRASGGGVARGAMTLVAGRPGMGKSGFSTSIACNMAFKSGAKGVIVSMEMSKREVLARMVSYMTGIDTYKQTKAPHLRTDAEKVQQAHALRKIKESGLKVYYLGGPTVEDVRAKVLLEKKKSDIDFVIVDHIGLIESSNGQSRSDQVGYTSRQLKRLVQDHEDIALIVLCQLNRGNEHLENKRPALHNLRDSGSLEQDANSVWFVYRQAMYDNEDPTSKNQPHEAEIIIGKSRDGETGITKTRFFPKNTAFRD